MFRSGNWKRFLFDEVDIPLESVILLIGGMALLVAGGLLFPISAGGLPYYENGLFGLLLIVFALQTMALGKTPFGDIHRSRSLFAFGLGIAALGIVTCFIPGVFGDIPRLLLFICFGLGGLLQLLRSLVDQRRLRSWLRYGGVFHHLVFACFAVYGLSMLAGYVLWTKPALPAIVPATIMLLFGAAVIYLGGVLRLVYRVYPETAMSRDGAFDIPFDRCLLLLTGVFMILLGALLIPVNLGWLTFAENAQLGLLMIIFAMQMIAFGNTPIGPFPHRSLFMVSLGILFAVLGIVSCVIPALLVAPLTRLVGVLNILGGIIPLGIRLVLSRRSPQANVGHPLLQRLRQTQLTMNLLSVMFGGSMFIPGLLPGLAVGLILAANGGVLLYLLRILAVIAVLTNRAEEPS
jgi:hypothetical protein